MRALVIDDEQLVLEGLEALLQASLPDLSLDKTADVATAMRLVASVQYELVLLDWHLVDPGGAPVDGDAVVEAVRAAGAKLPILVVSGDDRIDWPARVLALGLAGMVPKTASGAVLVAAIEVAMRGGIYLPTRARCASLEAPYRPVSAAHHPVDPREQFPDLTARQAEVFGVMARGLSDKQIARELGISDATVKTHVRAVLGIVGVGRRGEAVFKLTGGGDTRG